MGVGITNQSGAIASYLAQQQAGATRVQSPPAPNQASTTDVAPKNPQPVQARGEQVNFSPEALRLSAQSQAGQSSQTSQAVQQASAPQNANPYPPLTNTQAQEVKTASAQSVAQAINVYHNTFQI